MKEGACDNDRRFEQLGEHLLGEGLFVFLLETLKTFKTLIIYNFAFYNPFYF